MMSCPHCRTQLKTVHTPYGRMYVCPSCEGQSVGLAVLRTQFSRETLLNRMYLAARQAGRGAGRACPHCGSRMALVGFAVPGRKDDEPTVLDICVPCQFIWFDKHEMQDLTRAVPVKTPPAKASLKGREAMALLDVDRQNRAYDGGDAEHAQGPPHVWQYLPALLGMPVELETPSVQRKPLVTWLFGLAMAVTFLLLWITPDALEETINRWGFVPADWGREAGMTLLTSFFLHAGLLHLVSNLYFFLIFGDNVEESLGAVGMISLLGSAHLVGMLAHAAWDPRAQIPCVGASAGISGVIAYYALLFPRARLGFMWVLPWYLWAYRPLLWLRVRAIWALVLYVLLQSFLAWQQMLGQSSVSALAHLGGLSVGLVVGIFARISQRNQAELHGAGPRKDG